MVIQHNMTSSNANRQLGINTNNKKKTVERLSSGYRINRAADDAAGLSMSEKMRWSVRGLHQASRNIEDGSSLVQVADGGMNEIHAILQRQRELAVQAGNDTNTPADRNAIQQEINALSVEITRIANDTTFNTKHILNSEGNLTHGPVTADTAVLTLVDTPGINTRNGSITGFFATNAEGSIRSQLLYGSSGAGTSWMNVEVEVGGQGYRLYTYDTTDMSAHCSITNNILAAGVESTFRYSDDNGTPIFDVVRTITKMANPSGNGGEVYKMDFAVKNLTGEAMTASIEMEFDVKFSSIGGGGW
ncbi:flagellin [Roseburia sp. 499]|uniref:flagellin n=1 Tax=Roseburia sp. 499 TaxID=1261634 RepID=UPI0009533116|nr:flagellin [Roseburia sp. 499]WVK71632.1 flagellin [Roseburia sp. 499]